ncbi:MAG: outer membrane protein TolC [Pseudohongiellaceae bacterium]
MAFAASRLKLKSLRAAAQSRERSAEQGLIVYERGLEDYLTALDAQPTSAQQEGLQAQAKQLTNIALYKALGGGWKVYAGH